MNEETPKNGLWAYASGRFYAMYLELGDAKTDHASWFLALGLPDFGREYDKILRGRMTWDWHLEHFVLSFYGIPQLPNTIYDLVIRRFNQDGHKVVEKSISNYWVG